MAAKVRTKSKRTIPALAPGRGLFAGFAPEGEGWNKSPSAPARGRSSAGCMPRAGCAPPATICRPTTGTPTTSCSTSKRGRAATWWKMRSTIYRWETFCSSRPTPSTIPATGLGPVGGRPSFSGRRMCPRRCGRPCRGRRRFSGRCASCRRPRPIRRGWRRCWNGWCGRTPWPTGTPPPCWAPCCRSCCWPAAGSAPYCRRCPTASTPPTGRSCGRPASSPSTTPSPSRRPTSRRRRGSAPTTSAAASARRRASGCTST